MKTVCKKLLSLMLVAVLLVSAVPFQVFATEGETTADPTETTAATTEATEAAAETTVATEAPVAPASEEVQDVVNQPAANAITDKTYIHYVIRAAKGSVDWCVRSVETMVGAPISAVPSANDVMTRYAMIFGSTDGKQFSHWTYEDGTVVNTSNTYVTDKHLSGDGALYLYAEVVDKAQKIVLNANGGYVANAIHSVAIGETYNHLGTLPTPSRLHYTFQYWYKLVNGQEVPVNGDHTVTDTAMLYAKWAPNNYMVVFQRHNGVTWETVYFNDRIRQPIDAYSTLSTAAGTFPTDAEIAAYFALPGYTIVGWEIGDSDAAFTPGTTQILQDQMIIRPRYQRTVTLMANNPNDYTSNSTKTITVEIGEPIGKLPDPGARDGYAFVDWVAQNQETVISTKANLSNTSAHPNYDPAAHGTTFYVRWTESKVVYLYIHTNGNTQTATKIVPYYEAPSTGAFDLNLINMYSIFPSYGDYDDNVDTIHGWYSKSQWKNYSAGTASTWANNVFYDVGSNSDYQELHIMLINNGGSSSNNNNNNYNNNSSTADSSNPTTGDQIFMAVTVLAVSAAALAVIFFINKKRKASK